MDRTTITTALATAALLITVPGMASAQQTGQQQGTWQQYQQPSQQQFGQQQPWQQQQRWQGQQQPGQQFGQQQRRQQFGQQQRGQQSGQQQFAQRAQLEGEGAPLYASPGELMQVQQRLSQLGFDVGPQDGQWGSQTEQALEQFQQQRGLSPTGNINLATLSALGVQIGQDGQATAGMSGSTMQSQQRGQFGQGMQQRGQQFGQQQRGQQGFGQGQQQQQQFGQSQQLQGEGAQLYASPNEVRQVEQRLSQMGFDPGEADGRWSDQTEQALEQFQQQRGLSQTGNLNFSTLAALGVQIGQQQGQYLGIGEQQSGVGQQQGMRGQQQFERSGQTGQQSGGLQGQQSGSQGLSGFQSGQQQDQSDSN